MNGVIKKVLADKGFGFIEAASGKDVFFHCTSLVGLEFDERLERRPVRFEMADSEKGPRAVKVYAA